MFTCLHTHLNICLLFYILFIKVILSKEKIETTTWENMFPRLLHAVKNVHCAGNLPVFKLGKAEKSLVMQHAQIKENQSLRTKMNIPMKSNENILKT